MGKWLKKKQNKAQRILRFLGGIVTAAAAIAAAAITVQLLAPVVMGSGFSASTSASAASGTQIMDRFDAHINNRLSNALEGVVAIEKQYWLSDLDLVAPEPDQSCYGSTTDPSSLQWLLDEAERMLGVTDTLFTTDTKIKSGTSVTYYLDETILVIGWQEVIDNSVYSMSEVKIAHASQFRRFLADGTYGSDKQYYTTDMAATVNAVVASSGDFYKYRDMGVVVYNGTVYRDNCDTDMCFIDDNGDLIFERAGAFTGTADLQQYVDENNIRFSLAFGPVLVENYENVCPKAYNLGEINGSYSRAVLAQMGQLHYLLVAVNTGGSGTTPVMRVVAEQMVAFGVEKAYALDGGQTAAIVINDKLLNRPAYGTQRTISDIIYFATALPGEE